MIPQGDDFIDLLYRCEDDPAVIRMREELGVDCPTLGKEFKEDGYVAMENKPHRLELFFSDAPEFDIVQPQCPVILSRIKFYYRTDIALSFRLKMDESLDGVIAKIGFPPDFSNEHFPKKLGF